MALKEFLTSIADSIRKKTGETDQIPASEFSSRIEAIETGIDTTLSNGATSADIRVGKSSYANGEKIDGSMPDVEVTMGDISVSSSGLITATASLSGNGYIDTTPQPVTHQLATQGGKTITPTTTSQTAIATGRYAIGTVTVAGDTYLQSQYIKSGVSIFGVPGSYEGEGVVNAVTETVTATARATGRITFELSNPIKQLISYFILANKQLSDVYYALIYSSGEGMYQCVYGAEDGYHDIRLASVSQIEIEISGNYINFDDTAGSGFDDAVPRNCTCVGTFTYIAQ